MVSFFLLLFLIDLFYSFIFDLFRLCCCAQAFSNCDERGLLFVAARGLLIAVASHCRAWALGPWPSVVVARGLGSCGLRAVERRLSSCGTQA